MKDNRQFWTFLGMLIGALMTFVGMLFPILACSNRAKAAAVAADEEKTAQSAQIATCATELGHSAKRVEHYMAGWTLIYDRQERPSLQVFNGLGQIGLGAAVPQNVGLRFGIRAIVPVTVSGDPTGAQVVYYYNDTHGFSPAYPPVSFETAWATR